MESGCDLPDTAALSDFIAGRRGELVSSQLALTDVIRVVRRSCYDDQRRMRVDKEALDTRLVAAARLLDGIDLVVVDRQMFLAAAAFEHDPHVGSLDAIHLACAQEIGPELAAFITYDKRLRTSGPSCRPPIGPAGLSACQSRRPR